MAASSEARKTRGPGEIVGRVQAPERHGGAVPRHAFLVDRRLAHERRQHRRLRRHRRDGDDAHAERRALERQALGQGDDGALGRRVGLHARAAAGWPRSSAVIEKDAALLPLHHAQRVLGAEEDALDVDAHDPVEGRLVHVLDRRGELRHARVGVEDVEPAPARQRLADRRLVVRGLRHVRADGEGLPPCPLDLLDRRLGRRLLEVHDGDPRALAREHQRGGPADAEPAPVTTAILSMSFMRGLLSCGRALPPRRRRCLPSRAPARRASAGTRIRARRPLRRSVSYCKRSWSM